MKIKLALIYALLNTFFSFSQGGGGGGALCLYVNGDGVVVCTNYNNSGVQSEQNCRTEALLSNPACGLNMSAINIGAGSCASQIFGAPSVCINDVLPHNITSSNNQVSCETLGDRWCPSTFYGFFVGNSSCQTAICNYANGVLPVELIDFIAYTEDEENILNWSTASENNSDYYIVEHSIDGYSWNIAGYLPAAGNSTEIIGYKFIHKDFDYEINYYKLLQFDIDGKNVSYGPISIDNKKDKYEIISMTNILGQLVDENHKGLTIMKYSDGSIKKMFL